MRWFTHSALFVFLLSFSALAQQINLDTQIKGSRWPAFGTDSGTANAYVVTTIAPLGPGLRTGSMIQFVAVNGNTAASTLNVDSTGAKAIKKFGVTALASGDIPAGSMVTVIYDGTNYQMQGVLPTSGTTGSGSGCSTGLPGSHCAYYLNDGTTGTSLYHTVRFVDAGINQQHVRDFANSDPSGWGSGFIGICESGCGTSGLAEICYAGRCQVELSNAGTQGDFVDLGINTTNAPKATAVNAAGVNENPEVHTFFAKVHTTIALAGVTDVDMLPVGAYSTVQTTSFGTGYLALTFAGSPFITVSPFAISLTNNGGQTFPASSTNPILSSYAGYRAHSISNFGEWYDIYGRQLPGHSDSDLVIDDVASTGFSGGSLRIACDQASGCVSSLYHAWSHYSPAYGGTTGASVTGNITITDTQADSWNLKLTGNTTITSFNNVNAGHISNWNICQDATGGRTFTASALIGMPTITSTASACTTFSAFGIDNTHLYVFATGGGGGGSPTGSAGGDLGGTYPNPSVVKVNGGSVPASAGVAGTNSSSQIVAATAHGVAGPLTCADATGSTTTYTCTTTPTFTPAAKDCVWFTPQTTNTGASTLNVNSSSAAAVQKWLGTAVASGDLVGAKTQLVCYDGTNWQAMTIGNAPSGGGGISSATNNGAMYATGAATGTSTGALTDGQILIGDSTGAPQANTIVAGSNVTVTNGHHSITIASTGGGSTTYGPDLAALYCTANTFSCASRFNVVANTLIVATCEDYTNGTGAGTPTFSDTLSLTWTQIDTAINSSRQVSTWWANPGATTGADTFTCGNSNSTVQSNMSFGGMTVMQITGATLAGPIDAHVVQSGSNVTYNQAITTTANNDLIIMAAEYGGGWTAFQHTINNETPPDWFLIKDDTGNADTVINRNAKVAGTYYLQGVFSGAHAFSLFAIK